MKLMMVGTYGANRDNLFVYSIDPLDGSLALRSAIQAGPDPSFVYLDETRQVAFVVNEGGGTVQVFGKIAATSASSGQAETPTLISQTPSGGDAPCFLTLDPAGNYLLIANYNGRCVTICPVNADGTLRPICQTLSFTGSSVNTERQTEPHPHSVTFSPDGRYIYVPDLGSDKLWVYRWLGEGERPAADNEPAAISLPAGSGPRMICFSKDQQHAHVINELTATVSSFAYDKSSGNLTSLHEADLMPATFAGEKAAAHIAYYASRILASNRGHDSIATLTEGTIKHAATHGQTPRHFAIDTAAERLYVANQGSDNIVQFQLSAEAELSNPQLVAQVATPTCIAIETFAE